MPSRVCTIVPHRWTVSSGGRRRLRSASSSSLIRRPHSTIHCRGPSLSGCRCSYLEEFTPARYFCTFVACLPVTPISYPSPWPCTVFAQWLFISFMLLIVTHWSCSREQLIYTEVTQLSQYIRRHITRTSRTLTSLSCHERNAGTWWTFVFAVENSDLCSDIGKRPQVVNMTRNDSASLPVNQTARRRWLAGWWLTVDDTVFFHCLEAFRSHPELNLHVHVILHTSQAVDTCRLTLGLLATRYILCDNTVFWQYSP